MRKPIRTKNKEWRLYTYDPGGTTGYCIFEIYDDKAAVFFVDSGEFNKYYKLPEHFSEMDSENDIVLYERFHRQYSAPFVRKDCTFDAPEVIGAINILAIINNVTVCSQMPSERILMEKNNWHLRISECKSAHIKSALSHALHFLHHKYFKLGYNQLYVP